MIFFSFICFDYLTVTSNDRDLRRFFFGLMKKIPRPFLGKRRVLRLGGPVYRGWSFQGLEGPVTGEFGIGQRPSLQGDYFNFIITIPGAVCNLFVLDFLRHSKVLSGQWCITRLDLELTVENEMASLKQLRFFYWQFFNAQSSLEEPRARQVNFYHNQGYLLVAVDKKRQRQWKVYTSNFRGRYPREVNVRFEVTLKNASEYLGQLKKSGYCIDKCNFAVVRQALSEAAKTRLLAKHRYEMGDWARFSEKKWGLEGTHRFTELPPRGVRPQAQDVAPIKGAHTRQSRFQKELTSVAEALQSLAEMVTSKRPTFSHKQVQFLNDALSSRHWRVSWNIRQEWAIIPREGNPLWEPLFAPLPKEAVARRQATERRREALKDLASKIKMTVNHCGSLKPRGVTYVAEPTANKLLREIFEAVSASPVMDKSCQSLPRAKAAYSDSFEDKPAYVQEIIRARWLEKRGIF